MVTVDMSKARLQISKRKRRIRRSQRRRLQKAQRQQQAQLVAAGAARRARKQAVQNWLQEEKRRDKQRRNGVLSPTTPRVRFADNVSVTEIPTVPTHSLPKPVSSPTGVRLVRENTDQIMPGVKLMRGANGICFSVLYDDDDDYDEDNDPDFVPSELSDGIDAGHDPPARAKRRVIPQPIPMSASFASAQPASPNPGRSSNAYPTQPSSPQNKNLSQTTKQTENSSSPKPNELAKSSKRKRTHSQMLGSQPSIAPNLSPNASPGDPPQADENNISLAKPSDSPRRRKKKKRKLVHAPQDEQNGHHEPMSPKSADDRVSTKGAQSTARHSHDGAKSPLVSFTHDKDEATEQNGALMNGNNDDSDIDAMFGEMVQRKAQARTELRTRKRGDRFNGEKAVSDGNKGKIKRKHAIRYTEEGYRIMSYDELKEDQPAGLNGECPFDCSCCF